MEYTGYVGPGGYDEVIFRGDTDHRKFIALTPLCPRRCAVFEL